MSETLKTQAQEEVGVVAGGKLHGNKNIVFPPPFRTGTDNAFGLLFLARSL